MAIFYCNSLGSNTSPYDTWAKGATNLNALIVAATNVTDIIYVSENHINNGVSFAPPSIGNQWLPVKIICAQSNATPPVQLALSGQDGSTAAGTWGFIGNVYTYGMTYRSGGTTATSLSCPQGTLPSNLFFDNCILSLTANNANSRTALGQAISTSNDDIRVIVANSKFKFANAGQRVILRNGNIIIRNTIVDATGTVPTTLFETISSTQVNVLIENCDLSNISGTLVNISAAAPGRIVFRNCKLHPSVTITSGNPTGTGSTEVWLDNCDSGNQYFRTERYMGTLGKVITETSKVL